MDELFTKYERELVTLRSLCREYAQRYPKVAAQLQLDGETCNDPHVERLIQGVALLSARVAKRLDDAYPQFTESLLNLLFPHYLRPFPSCAIARVQSLANDEPGTIPELPRGTLLESAPQGAVPCTFRTVYDVKAPSALLQHASFDTAVSTPLATRLPEGVSATLRFTFAAARPSEPVPAANVSPMRLYIDGDASFCAALRDALFMHTRAAFLQLDEHGPWERLSDIPVTPSGFADDDALIPLEARTHTAYRLLAEYFAFPEKFNFFDIDLPALLRRLPTGRTHFTLHLAVTDIAADSDKARMLANLSKQQLLPGCTPVVNLFPQPAVPVTYNQLSSDYPLLAHGSHPQAFEVYSVERVHMVRQSGTGKVVTQFRPFYSLQHGEESTMNKEHYWMMRHDEALAVCSPGHEKSITLVNADCEPLEIERNFLSIDLCCTNRDLPCSLKLGAPDGDLFIPGAGQSGVIHLLRRPSRTVRLTNTSGMHWRLISHLTLNHHSLAREGAQGLREMLALYDFAPSSVSRRQIAGIQALEQRESTTWMRHKRGSSLVHGTEIRLTLDEQAYAGAGLHLLAQVLDQFFALYVQLNSFVELVILSQQSGKELFRCKPRSGRMALL